MRLFQMKMIFGEINMSWENILKIEWEIPENEKIDRKEHEWFNIESYDTVEDAEKELARRRSKSPAHYVYRLVKKIDMKTWERIYMIQAANNRTGKVPPIFPSEKGD